jgi:hypothetical protein
MQPDCERLRYLWDPQDQRCGYDLNPSPMRTPTSRIRVSEERRRPAPAGTLGNRGPRQKGQPKLWHYFRVGPRLGQASHVHEVAGAVAFDSAELLLEVRAETVDDPGTRTPRSAGGPGSRVRSTNRAGPAPG